MTNENKNKKLQILDIYLSAYLKYHGVKLSPVKKSARVVFEVEDSEKTRNLMEGFNSNTKIPVLDFVGSIKEIKALIFAEKVRY